MIKSQLKNLMKTINLVKEVGSSLLMTSIGISLLQGITPIFSMLIVQNILNIITSNNKDFRTLMISFSFYIGLTLLKIGIEEIDGYIDTKLQILLHYKMNHLVMQKTAKLTLAEFETPEIYDDITRIQNQISYKPFQIYKSIIAVISSAVSFVSSVIILLNWKVSILPLLIILPIISIYIYLKIGKNEFEMLYRRSSEERGNWYISHLLTHDFAVKELRLGALESYFLNKYDKNNQLFISQENKVNKSKMKYGLFLGVLEVIIQAVILLIAIREAFLGVLLIGYVTTFIRALSTMQTSTQNIVNNIYSFYNGSMYMKLLYDFTRKKADDRDQTKNIINTIQTLEFEQVSFSYDGKDKAINNISFFIKSGEKIAIVGKNGSGKSTIFKLACGLYDNYEFEEGRQLSGGQWQKIALSRAYLKDADCYFLDEPSSALDPVSETKIFKTFFDLSQDKIGLFITHKPSITQFVDQILYLEDGCVVEKGSFADLNSTGKKFKHLLDKEIGVTYDTSN